MKWRKGYKLLSVDTTSGAILRDVSFDENDCSPKPFELQNPAPYAEHHDLKNIIGLNVEELVNEGIENFGAVHAIVLDGLITQNNQYEDISSTSPDSKAAFTISSGTAVSNSDTPLEQLDRTKKPPGWCSSYVGGNPHHQSLIDAEAPLTSDQEISGADWKFCKTCIDTKLEIRRKNNTWKLLH